MALLVVNAKTVYFAGSSYISIRPIHLSQGIFNFPRHVRDVL